MPDNAICCRDLKFRGWEYACPAFALNSDLGWERRIYLTSLRSPQLARVLVSKFPNMGLHYQKLYLDIMSSRCIISCIYGKKDNVMNRLNKRRFSELSYSFSFLENMIRNTPPGQRCCPILPNLFLEGRLGYDVKMRMPGAIFFFQFKIPNAVIYSSAYERKHFKIRSQDPFCGLQSTFLRMPITKSNISKQHEILVDLQDRKRNTSARVFYATPLFISPRVLGEKFKTSSVPYSSGFISPEEMATCFPLIATSFLIIWKKIIKCMVGYVLTKPLVRHGGL